MTARDIISPFSVPADELTLLPTVEASTAMVDVISRLMDTPERRLAVVEEGDRVGMIDRDSALEGVARLLPGRDDCSVLELECVPADYSAALLTHAAEDADVHVVGLWTSPTPEGKVRVTMRLRCEDPVHVVRNLERYGFDVVEVHARIDTALEIASRRLEELRIYMGM